jgi:predicted RNase H-like nuclease
VAELVAGVDGCKRGWVAVILTDGRFREARLLEGVESSFAELADADRIAIDIPIGYGPRAADALARAVVGGSSVFSIPEREKFEAPFAEGGGISAQAYALGERIRHVTALATTDPRFREVHPEACFTAMNDRKRLRFRKKSAGGAFERLALLQRHGINIDRGMLGAAATIPLDDLLDAAACAWTASRRDAVSLPEPPEQRDGLSIAIWV